MSGDDPKDDVTVLRSDPSVSSSFSSEGSGEADAPRVLKQRFVLEEKLGSGGMGTVFRAKDLRKVEARDRQPYLAIKVLNNDFREHPEAFIALQREAAKSQALSHRNIVSIFDFDKDGDVPFITMELLEGQELAELIRAYPGGLPEAMAWAVIRGICAGLRHAHEAGIVHADFKPGNVYVAPDNTPKILDFGIARAVQMTESSGEDTLFDPARLAALTPAYASREMLAGNIPEPRDDLYSLGIVIYLILTGRHPYNRLSAEDAANEGLKPEKPKSLSRRQWRAVSACLAFDREERPSGMDEVEDLLLTPSPWPARTVIAVSAILLVALSVNWLLGDAELNEVRQEVRQTTLLDAQLARMENLLAEPAFDENWEDLIAQEFKALAALESGFDVHQEVTDRILELYGAEIAGTDDLDRALALIERGSEYGDLSRAREDLGAKAAARVRHLLDNARPESAWIDDLKRELDFVRRGFGGTPLLAELELEVGDTLEVLVMDALNGGNVDAAESMLAELDTGFVDGAVRAALETAVTDGRQAQQAEREARQAAVEVRRKAEALQTALSEPCLRLDAGAMAGFGIDELGVAAEEMAASRFRECVRQLAEFDPDRAMEFAMSVQKHFGRELLGADFSVDPCSLSYLVGNGAQPGRRGYCVDRLGADLEGPKLVVVAGADGGPGFAIMKEEVSWRLFRRFCAEHGHCEAEPPAELETDERLPVTGISAETGAAYARWLSGKTGFTYRLPTVDEWSLAAGGEPDPNRNCRVQLDGVERGLSPVAADAGQGNAAGLINVLGNVQEWVVEGDRLLAAGGSYADPIAECLFTTLREHAGEPSADTGFRLVRELS